MLACSRFVVLLAAVSAPAWADVVVNTSLNLTNLGIAPSSGTVNILPPVTASAFAQALDSEGGFDQNYFSVNNASTGLILAMTALANASAQASAPSLTGAVTANVNIPSLNAWASSEGQATLSGAFDVTGSTNPVDVTFSASLIDNQLLQLNQFGLLGKSESIFTLTVPNISSNPILFFDNLLTAGPSQTISYSNNPALSVTYSLSPNTSYSFVAALDAESYGVDSTPEPSSIVLLITALGAGAFPLRRWFSRAR